MACSDAAPSGSKVTEAEMMRTRDRFDQRGIGSRRLAGVVRGHELHLDAAPAKLNR